MAAETVPAADKIWTEALEKLKSAVPNQTFNTWFNSTLGVYLDNDILRVALPNQFAVDWVKEKYGILICDTLAEILGSRRSLEFIVAPDIKNFSQDNSLTSNGKNRNSEIVPKPASSIEIKKHSLGQPVIPETKLNHRYIFDSFVVGDANRFAHAAAMAVSEDPLQTRYNPLYIYGGVGLGKTHLVQAIGNYVCKNFANLKILYVTSEKFTNDFIEAIGKQRTSDFARHYRGVDLLLLDDIQFLTGKEATQEQFFHTFNALYQAGKQIVLTSDRSPREIKGLEERLLSRFQCGLVSDIQPPDFETRIAILQQKVEAERAEIPSDVITYIANNITRNIRELEGSIIRLLAYVSLHRKEINISLAHEILKDAFTTGFTINSESITQAVCEYFHIQTEQMKSKRKTAELVRARQIAMYLCRKHTSTSLKAIGEEFGGRDHSTVIHSITMVEEGSKIDLALKADVESIENKLKS